MLVKGGPIHIYVPIPCYIPKIDGLVQQRRNSIANALELCLSCTNPLKWNMYLPISFFLFSERSQFDWILTNPGTYITGLGDKKAPYQRTAQSWPIMLQVLIDIGSGNGFLLDSTKFLPELILICQQYRPVTLTWVQFHWNAQNIIHLNVFEN